MPIASPLVPAPAARSGCAWRRSQKAALWDGGVPGDYMAIFLADMPPLPPRPPKQHAQISWLAKGGRFYLFSLSRRSRDETSFGSCCGGQDVAPLALLASLGLTTTLVHEKKHEGQHRGKNDRRASQDIKVVRGHEKHSTDDGQHLPRPQRVDLGQPLTFVWRRWRPQSPHGGPTGVRGGVSGRKFAPFPLESGWLSTAGQWQHADG